MQPIDDYITKAQHLVPAPHVLSRLLPLVNRTDVDTGKIVELISYDTSLTASVLRICNSAYYSRGTPIDNLLQAVSRLGSSEIYKIVVAVTGAAALSANRKSHGAEEVSLWQHSVATAVTAQLLAREVREEDSVAFTAAILHDVGKIILSAALEKSYEKFMEETANGATSVEAEATVFGCDHAEVGGRLLERWKLPDQLVDAVRHHHTPSATDKHRRLAACVCLGDIQAHFMGYGYGCHAVSTSARDAALKVLNISAEQLSQYTEKSFSRSLEKLLAMG